MDQLLRVFRCEVKNDDQALIDRYLNLPKKSKNKTTDLLIKFQGRDIFKISFDYFLRMLNQVKDGLLAEQENNSVLELPKQLLMVKTEGGGDCLYHALKKVSVIPMEMEDVRRMTANGLEPWIKWMDKHVLALPELKIKDTWSYEKDLLGARDPETKIIQAISKICKHFDHPNVCEKEMIIEMIGRPGNIWGSEAYIQMLLCNPAFLSEFDGLKVLMFDLTRKLSTNHHLPQIYCYARPSRSNRRIQRHKRILLLRTTMTGDSDGGYHYASLQMKSKPNQYLYDPRDVAVLLRRMGYDFTANLFASEVGKCLRMGLVE